MWGLKIPLHKYFLAAVSHRHLFLIAQHLLQCPTHMQSQNALLTDSAEGKSLLLGQLVHIQSFASKYSLWLNSLGKMPVAGSPGKDKSLPLAEDWTWVWFFIAAARALLLQPWAGKSLGTSDYLKIVSWVWKEVFPSHFREREHASPETGKLYDVWECVCEWERQTGKREKGEKHILAFKGQLLSVSATGVKFLWPLVRWTSFNHVFQMKALSDFPPDFCRNDLNTGRPERILSRNYGDDLVIWVRKS